MVGIKLLEQGLAQNRLSKYISCHNNCHDWYCSQTSGVCLSGDKEWQIILRLAFLPDGGAFGCYILRPLTSQWRVNG